MRVRETMFFLMFSPLFLGCGQTEKSSPPQEDEMVLSVKGMV